jgi:hypothetical protein
MAMVGLALVMMMMVSTLLKERLVKYVFKRPKIESTKGVLLLLSLSSSSILIVAVMRGRGRKGSVRILRVLPHISHIEVHILLIGHVHVRKRVVHAHPLHAAKGLVS